MVFNVQKYENRVVICAKLVVLTIFIGLKFCAHWMREASSQESG